jgi:hypothetical protein
MAWDRDQWRDLLNAVMNILVPEKARNSLTSWVTVSFSRRILLMELVGWLATLELSKTSRASDRTAAGASSYLLAFVVFL